MRRCLSFSRRRARSSPPAAIVAHLYDRDFEAHALWAEANDLKAELLPESWYYPGSAIAVVYTPAIPDNEALEETTA